jgi:signal peptidase I
VTELRPWTWPWLIATTCSRAVLATVICLGLWGALPAAIGWHPTTVSSGSMLPRLHVGDIAVSRPLGATPPTVGSVLLFDDPDHPGRLRLHRFVRIGDDGMLVTRGDANNGDDSSPVALSAVRGIGTLRVPWVALPVVWIREGTWLPLSAALLVLLGLTALTAQSRKFGFPEPGPDDDGAGPPDDGQGSASDGQGSASDGQGSASDGAAVRQGG